MKVAFRVDASQAIGTGHLRRSIALAEALAGLQTEIRFIIRDLGLDPLPMLAQHGFGCELLPSPDGDAVGDPTVPHADWAGVASSLDADETAKALIDWKPDWVIIDSYAFDCRWHGAVRRGLGCRIAQIDDVADRSISPDLLIDHTHSRDHAAKYSRWLKTPARILGGPLYALLAPRYRTAPRYDFHDGVRSVGIFMGGVDSGNHSATVLDALERAGFHGPIEVVSTSFNPHLGELSQRIACRPHAALTLDLPDLARFFARHDLQVGAGGGASWERCCIGAPTLLVVVAANQDEVVPRLKEDGIVVASPDATAEGIAEEFTALLGDPDKRRAMAARGRALVDGRGAMRVARVLQSCE